MRTLWHPLKKNVKIDCPELSLAVVTHYTEHKYHARRMEVVRLCLDSMLANMRNIPHELLIFDNGSTPEFRAMLMEYKPNAITFSENIGAHNARRALVNQALGKLICMTDDDILFHPDWFSMQFEVLRAFPSVGAVSGSPQRSAFQYDQESNKRLALNTPGLKFKRGKFIPDQWISDYCTSIGRELKEYSQFVAPMQDVVIENGDVRAYGHGHHMQYLGYTKVIRQHERGSEFYLGNGRDFTHALDQAGYMNLTTWRRSAIHIGNVVDPRIKEIAKEWQVPQKEG